MLSIGAGESFTFAFRGMFKNVNAASAGDHGIAAQASNTVREWTLFVRADAGLTDIELFFTIAGVGFVGIPNTALAFDVDFTTVIAEFDQPNGIMRLTLNDDQVTPYETTGLSGSVPDANLPFKIGHVGNDFTEKYNGALGTLAYFRGLMSSADKTTFHANGDGVRYADVSGGSPAPPSLAWLPRHTSIRGDKGAQQARSGFIPPMRGHGDS